ncbi:MAG TPA: hypothetical protein VGR43_01015 [Dehalococcoidia bacterium]|jgi:hypothetical protein|nr:hypothetical protein [Dehalococcoidia bacterium]
MKLFADVLSEKDPAVAAGIIAEGRAALAAYQVWRDEGGDTPAFRAYPAAVQDLARELILAVGREPGKSPAKLWDGIRAKRHNLPTEYA